ncbi:MAG TPA: class F sortase [Streptosporangiaceae bacterium]|nr:class F sortase [Streptosporangiaceae bacterium]
MIRPLAGRPAAIVAVVAGVIAAGAGAAGLLTSGSGTTPAPLPHPAAAIAPTPAGQEVAVGGRSAGYQTPRPVALVIPAIGVNARLVDLGLTAAGTVQVPADPASPGWYTGSSRPGAIGSSVLLGHIDSPSGPAVFYRLGQLRPGERVYVRRADGTLAVFRIDAVRRYLKSHFPTAAVYGPAPDPELRLISCTGVFDQNLKSYLSNVVVYATAIT